MIGLEILVAAIIGIISLTLALYFIRHFKIDSKDEQITEGVITERTKTKEKVNKKSYVHKEKKNDSKFRLDHPWVISTLRGHQDNITSFDISSNGRYIITVGEDSSIYFWRMKDIFQKERKIVRNTIDLDYATNVQFTPDDKACIVSLAQSNTIRAYKIKKEDSKYSFEFALEFQKKIDEEIINIGISTNGNYIMTCHSNTSMIIWTVKGDVLQTIDTGNMYNYYGTVSPCGRFVTSCGFASDAKLWAVEFDKSNNLKGIVKAFVLKGHKSSILSVAFNNNGTRLATISKDGNWRLWDIGVDYRNQEAVLIKSGNINLLPIDNSRNVKKSHFHSILVSCLSASSFCLAIAQQQHIWFIDTDCGEVCETIALSHESSITRLLYEQKNMLFFSAGGRHVNVYRDVVEDKVKLRHLQAKLVALKAGSSGDVTEIRRITEQIKELEKKRINQSVLA